MSSTPNCPQHQVKRLYLQALHSVNQGGEWETHSLFSRLAVSIKWALRKDRHLQVSEHSQSTKMCEVSSRGSLTATHTSLQALAPIHSPRSRFAVSLQWCPKSYSSKSHVFITEVTYAAAAPVHAPPPLHTGPPDALWLGPALPWLCSLCNSCCPLLNLLTSYPTFKDQLPWSLSWYPTIATCSSIIGLVIFLVY